MNKFKIGADPELFLEDKEGNIISAEGLVGGTKHEPKLISDYGHAVQEDNIMLEFNIPPSSTLEEFKYNINYIKSYINNTFNKKGLFINKLASSYIDKKYLKTSQSKMFGCEPDYNVYLKQMNDPPPNRTNLRCCGKMPATL